MSATYRNEKNPGNQTSEKAAAPAGGEAKIPVNGLQQVIDMLRVADPAFRDSLLKRLAARDRELARVIMRDLGM
ncbi:MAG: hypothetical protein AABZ55_02280 [Bdellovibrionota bacterium]|mgnify:CR=1 FL=1